MKDKTLSEKIRRKKRSSFKEYFKQNYLLYVLLLPLIVYLLIFSYYPMLGIQIAFKDWRIRGGIWGSPWATTDGALDLLKHFKLLFGDSLFLGKFINTLRISTHSLDGIAQRNVIYNLQTYLSDRDVSSLFHFLGYHIRHFVLYH